jgi:hypothetical protein
MTKVMDSLRNVGNKTKKKHAYTLTSLHSGRFEGHSSKIVHDIENETHTHTCARACAITLKSVQNIIPRAQVNFLFHKDFYDCITN